MWLQPDYLLRVRSNHSRQDSDLFSCWFTGGRRQRGQVAILASSSVAPVPCLLWDTSPWRLTPLHQQGPEMWRWEAKCWLWISRVDNERNHSHPLPRGPLPRGPLPRGPLPEHPGGQQCSGSLISATATGFENQPIICLSSLGYLEGRFLSCLSLPLSGWKSLLKYWAKLQGLMGLPSHLRTTSLP